MNPYSLSHVSDSVLLRGLATHLSDERANKAGALADIAEVDARKLYVPAGYPSMRAYLVGEFHLTEESATKRIGVARAARRYPCVLEAVADGRLHMTAVVLLAPYLSPENARELLAAATHKTTFEIKQLIAEWFPRLAVPTQIRPIGLVGAGGQQDSNPVGTAQQDSNPVQTLGPMGTGQQDLDPVDRGPASPAGARVKVEPLAPQLYEMRAPISQRMLDKLQYARALLGHRVAPGEEVEVLERGLDALIHELEKDKFATDRPRRSQRRSTNKRYIPAAVKCAVWRRDGGRCTFVSTAGRRCAARHALEFDHIDPVARGGQATVGNMRLRCRAHNQYEAERTFGAEFMRHKRERAQRAAAMRRAEKEAARRATEEGQRAKEEARRTDAEAKAWAAATKQAQEEVVSCLRSLGMRAEESRRAAALCETIPHASLEERVRLALSCFGPRRCSIAQVAPSG